LSIFERSVKCFSLAEGVFFVVGLLIAILCTAADMVKRERGDWPGRQLSGVLPDLDREIEMQRELKKGTRSEHYAISKGNNLDTLRCLIRPSALCPADRTEPARGRPLVAAESALGLLPPESAVAGRKWFTAFGVASLVVKLEIRSGVETS